LKEDIVGLNEVVAGLTKGGCGANMWLKRR